MGALLQLLEQLILQGPARNPAEAEELLQLGRDAVAAFEHHTHNQPTPEPAPAAPEVQSPFGGTL